MPSLDNRGAVGAAFVGAYAPIAVLTFILLIRYGLRRDAGWLWLNIFALTRIAEGALLLAGELMKPPKPILLDAAHIMDFAGIAPLMLSTLGFLGMAGQNTYSDNPRVATLLRLVALVILAGIGLTTAGGILGIQAHSNHSSAKLLREIGNILYAISYVCLFIAHIGTWTYRWHLRSYRRNLLFGISTALPLLGVRIAYSVLQAFSASDVRGLEPSSNPTLAKLNPVTGNFTLWLVLSVIMEFIVALLYLYSSTVLAKKHHHH
ncbi:hypothetical protein D9619_002870 [Psilocybe cf. subviscida]|uniref:DUF7702 domain-containing protein n=1 Tax=Psilocybe cf. subviscida TaxID=2480587 RepID=A0A8H5AY82_9AGAR|nr:hypothetical protein D9619_002870 [Psilocybe cf. subviscida]